MKSNRLLLLILLVIIVVFGAAAGYLYTANSAEKKAQTDWQDKINADQLIINKNVTNKNTLDADAADIAKQQAIAKESLANINFRSDAQSIEYDRLLYAIADAAKVRITVLNASPPADVKEQNNNYQLTTFSMTVEGLSPEGIFGKPDDDKAYISMVVNYILDFTSKIATSPDFDTAVIQSVSITEPNPMDAGAIQALIDGINAKIQAEIQDQIDARATQIQTDNEATLTQDQIDALIATETADMVAKALSAKTPDEIKTLVDQAGIVRPSAVIIINIWTYKGA